MSQYSKDTQRHLRSNVAGKCISSTNLQPAVSRLRRGCGRASCASIPGTHELAALELGEEERKFGAAARVSRRAPGVQRIYAQGRRSTKDIQPVLALRCCR